MYVLAYGPQILQLWAFGSFPGQWDVLFSCFLWFQQIQNSLDKAPTIISIQGSICVSRGWSIRMLKQPIILKASVTVSNQFMLHYKGDLLIELCSHSIIYLYFSIYEETAFDVIIYYLSHSPRSITQRECRGENVCKSLKGPKKSRSSICYCVQSMSWDLLLMKGKILQKLALSFSNSLLMSCQFLRFAFLYIIFPSNESAQTSKLINSRFCLQSLKLMKTITQMWEGFILLRMETIRLD